jgi:hypothetical protein
MTLECRDHRGQVIQHAPNIRPGLLIGPALDGCALDSHGLALARGRWTRIGWAVAVSHCEPGRGPARANRSRDNRRDHSAANSSPARRHEPLKRVRDVAVVPRPGLHYIGVIVDASDCGH